MKVLLSWLRDFAPFDQTAEAIGDAFNDLGTPVEEVTEVGGGLDGIVVAEVLALRPHPDADRIQVIDVDAGEGEALQICCGAFNMSVGDHVPLATLGTTMPDGMVIARRKMRGEWSNGMLCSSAEIGLGPDAGDDEHRGIRILGPATAPGTPLAEALGIDPDVLWDLEVNPNRPDALCVAGLARDLSAHFGVPFALPEPTVATSGEAADLEASVEIVDPDLCGRFTAWVLRDISSAPSPEWMQQRLGQVGMRPIGGLVDISNYVMLELGQPNHPYDLVRVPGGGFRVRRAADGESLVTLDGIQRRFTPDDLLICGADDVALGIAGVMGGASAEISEATTDVLLEMAWFLPQSVSRTSRRLGLRTEASARFERGCDPEVIDLAAARFAGLAAGICGSELAPGSVDARGDLPERRPVRVRTARVNQVLGTDLDRPSIAGLLEPIGFAVSYATEAEPDAGDDLDVTIPSWRYDSTGEIDVVEEVARHHGYSRIPSRELTTAHAGRLRPRQRYRREVRRLLTGLGLAEVMPLPFLAPSQLTAAGFPPDGIGLLNSLVADESILRTTLLPGLLGAAVENAQRRRPDVRLFEIGHVFLPPPGDQFLPDEREHLGVFVAGAEAPAAVEIWQRLTSRLGPVDIDLRNEASPGLHPTRSGRVSVAGTDVGVVGEIDPDVLSAHGLDGRVAWLEVDLGALIDAPRRVGTARPVSRFPSADVDLAFVAPDALSALALERALALASPLVWSVELFDTYRGDGVESGSRSLAYAVRFDAPDRTLLDAEVADARVALIDAAAALGATLRGA